MLGTNHPWDEYDDDLVDLIKIKKLNIELTPDVHAEIKKRAAVRGITLKKYVMRAIMDRIRKERELGEK